MAEAAQESLNRVTRALCLPLAVPPNDSQAEWGSGWGEGALLASFSAGPALCVSVSLVQAVGEGAGAAWRPGQCEHPAGSSRVRGLAARAQAQCARSALADHRCQVRGLSHGSHGQLCVRSLFARPGHRTRGQLGTKPPP